jgi:hypothetical protein
MVGWELADHHEWTRGLGESLEELRGYGIDRVRLRELADEFRTLDAMDNPNARGLKLEPFIRELLAAHGFEVEKGKHREGEQVDLIVHRPIRALVECRWYAEPVGRPAITELIGKLTRDRPAIVSGIYVSMNGFTEPARTEAREQARDRVVVLLDRADVLALLHGQQHARELVDERIDELVRRYDADVCPPSARRCCTRRCRYRGMLRRRPPRTAGFRASAISSFGGAVELRHKQPGSGPG